MGEDAPNVTRVTMNRAQLSAPSPADALVALIAAFQLAGRNSSSPKASTTAQPADSSARRAKVESQKMLVTISRPR
jgi:hypothetical protein